ncbi:ABC transporter permease, partial [Sulfolobus sp. B5]
MSRVKESSLYKQFKEFIGTKIGLAGLIILLVLLVFTGIALSIPSKVYSSWNNPAAWSEYPAHVPPSWISIFYPNKYFTTQKISPTNTTYFSPSKNIYINIITFSFNWTKTLPAYNVYFIVSTNTSIIEEVIYWTKPDGSTIQLTIPS